MLVYWRVILNFFYYITTCQGLAAIISTRGWTDIPFFCAIANFHNQDWYLKNVDVELAWEENHICIPGANKELGALWLVSLFKGLKVLAWLRSVIFLYLADMYFVLPIYEW